MSLIRKAEVGGNLLNAVSSGVETGHNPLDDITVDDALRRLPRNTAADLCEIAAADVQRIGIVGHITVARIVGSDNGEELVVEFAAAALQTADFAGPTSNERAGLVDGVGDGDAVGKVDCKGRL